ncbi:MAG: chemotaxis protein CheD [Deltaproteobacteria bacterium]|nr:chemotaxis protein CheD [Deltaproteobacteria bacterium]MBW2016332.1 chemotaxis protein CheD [Deltaproteobacteria bacterium]MBW2128917.1 chemotaxis protein CheD [Deltaproteobacteria bacterium]
MGTIMLGVGDLAATNSPGDVIKTLALGSCVAVMMLDPVTRSVGMVHVALPHSEVNDQKAREKPGYFADTGVPALLDEMRKRGYRGNGKGMIVKLAGGAKIMDPGNTFNIGKRNVLAIKKALWSLGMGTVGEDVGGSISRNVAVDVNTGSIVISSTGRNDWYI